MLDTLKTKKLTSLPIKGRQNLYDTSSMTALKHLKPLFGIAVIALICVTTLRPPKNVPT